MSEKRLNADAGLLVLRVGLGAMMLTHGVPKLLKGPDLWPKLGDAVEAFGVTFGHSAFGAAAVAAETVCAAMVIVGWKARPVATMIVATMAVAAAMHLDAGHSWNKTSHALETGIGFLAIAVAGAGRYRIGRS